MHTQNKKIYINASISPAAQTINIQSVGVSEESLESPTFYNGYPIDLLEQIMEKLLTCQNGISCNLFCIEYAKNTKARLTYNYMYYTNAHRVYYNSTLALKELEKM